MYLVLFVSHAPDGVSHAPDGVSHAPDGVFHASDGVFHASDGSFLAVFIAIFVQLHDFRSFSVIFGHFWLDPAGHNPAGD